MTFKLKVRKLGLDAVGAQNIEGDRANAGHHAGPGADAAGVLAQGHVPDVMGPVLYAPVCTDGAAQDLGPVTGLARVVADLLARGPQAGAGVLDVGHAR